jgi:hypothetical protein
MQNAPFCMQKYARIVRGLSPAYPRLTRYNGYSKKANPSCRLRFHREDPRACSRVEMM